MGVACSISSSTFHPVFVYFPGFFICSSVFFPWKVSCARHTLWSMHPCQIILVIKLCAAEWLIFMWLYIYCCCIIDHNAGVFFLHLYLIAFQGQVCSFKFNWLMWDFFFLWYPFSFWSCLQACISPTGFRLDVRVFLLANIKSALCFPLCIINPPS